MANDGLTTGALFLGGGVAGYALGRAVFARWLDTKRAPTATSSAPTEPAAPTTPAAPVPSVPAQARTSPTPTRPTERPSEPASRLIDPYAAPATSPSHAEVPPATSVPDGPVTSPSQVEAASDRPASAPEKDPEFDHRPSRRFDRIFDMYRGEIPVEFLRALARRESGLNPEESKGPAWGLMQIVEVVRRDYNRAHKTTYTRHDLLDPTVNVAMACWLLQFIIAQYAKHHGDVANLRADWDNPHFARLLVYGWNAGFSSSGGVIRVVRYLKARGHTDITIDLVHKHARAAGASRHLSNPKKVAWCKSVVRLYEQERAAARVTTPPMRASAHFPTRRLHVER
jgi:soluble lytic murein transglycosylase-like protein